MSFYHLKKLTVTENQIFVTIADSSVKPLEYYTSEYCESKEVSIEDKLNTFLQDLLSGNFRANGNTKLGRLYKSGRNMIAAISDGCIMNVFEGDFRFETHFYEDLKRYVARSYLMPQLLKKQAAPDYIYERNFATNCNKEWQRIINDLKSKHITVATAAITVKYLKNKVLAVTMDGQLAFVNDENYQLRFINDADGSTVFFGSESDWITFAYPSKPKKDWFIGAIHRYPELEKLIDDFIEN